VHGAAGGIGTALLQLGRLAGLELYGTGTGTQIGVISALGATAIDYTQSSFVERIRELTGDGVDVALDGIGGGVALGSYRLLRRGGRLVMYGHYGTTVGGRKSARKAALFYLSGALVFAANVLPNGKRVLAFQVAKLRDQHPEWFREDAATLFDLLAQRKIEPIVAERIPLVDARQAHENLGRGGVTGKQVPIFDEQAAGCRLKRTLWLWRFRRTSRRSTTRIVCRFHRRSSKIEQRAPTHRVANRAKRPHQSSAKAGFRSSSARATGDGPPRRT
jgi:hypothetical protein